MSGPTLRAGALGLGAVLMQGISHIAPAAGVVLALQFLTQQAGARAPLAFALAFLLVIPLGLSLTQLARHLPSAGGYYSYLSHTVGPRAGFLTAWLYFLYDPVATAINLGYMGALLQQALLSEWGLRLPWWLFLSVSALAIGALSLRGVRGSTGVLVALALGEIGIVLCLCATGLLRPGPASPPPPPSPTGGLYLAVVLSIFSFTGFESVVPLAEESAAPRRNLPRAILLSIGLMGAFYVFSSYALLRGVGAGGLAAFQRAPEHPLFGLARRLWGGAWLLLLLALLNSVLAVSIACTNAATRVFFAMGRAGALPRILGRVHPRHRTPWVAVLLQTALTIGLGLGLGRLFGPVDAFFLMGLVMTLGMVLVYSAGNLGVWRLYGSRGGERRGEFSFLLHLACPLLSTAALLFVGWKSLSPPPAAPVGLAPYVTGTWLLLGLGLLLLARLRGREGSLLRAGAAAYGGAAPADADGARSGARGADN